MELDNLIAIAARKLINTGKVSNSKYWQGIENPNPLFQAIKIYLGPAFMPESIQILNTVTKANQPWAEENFQERICGKPLNPGETYKSWPFYGSDSVMRPTGVFTHTYMERIWPKYVNGFERDIIESPESNINYPVKMGGAMHGIKGIRYEYGDLNDLIKLLIKDPETRQAFLPIWFPEDTGAVHGGRVPCSIGYLFQIVEYSLHMTYYIRSCDFVRHLRDDIYHAVRLAQHILLSLKMANNKFKDIGIGLFDMHIGSLHCFNMEVNKIKKEHKGFEVVDTTTTVKFK